MMDMERVRKEGGREQGGGERTLWTETMLLAEAAALASSLPDMVM